LNCRIGGDANRLVEQQDSVDGAGNTLHHDKIRTNQAGYFFVLTLSLLFAVSINCDNRTPRSTDSS
jgi:hypothetical protein